RANCFFISAFWTLANADLIQAYFHKIDKFLQDKKDRETALKEVPRIRPLAIVVYTSPTRGEAAVYTLLASGDPDSMVLKIINPVVVIVVVIVAAVVVVVVVVGSLFNKKEDDNHQMVKKRAKVRAERKLQLRHADIGDDATYKEGKDGTA
nr:hypothetical protein [Tanacetum cinerariifolium]